MGKLIVLLFLVVSVNVTWAEDPVYFADANLKAAVEAQLGISDPTPTDMLGLTSLEARSLEIEDPNGIQYAINLTYLNMQRNQIIDISSLSDLTNLTTLDLLGNQIIDISALSDLINLTTLWLNANQINDISALSDLTNLTYIDLMNNHHITDISVLFDKVNLTFLRLANNQITDISPLSNLTNLTVLLLEDNQIADVSPLSNLINLTALALERNYLITDISALSNLTNLTLFWAWSNQISDISAISNMTNLTSLNLMFNQIEDISPVSGLTNLTYLALGNSISDISSLSNLTNLTELYLYQNQITDISPLSELTSLSRLHIEYNLITDISALSGLTNLWELRLEYNQIADISALSGMPYLTHLRLDNNYITDISSLAVSTTLKNVVLLSNPLDCNSYCIHIPAIEANNPGLNSLLYDPMPESCECNVVLYEWYTNPANGHRYALTLEHSNWADAEAEAIAVGGHLVTVNDQAECDWLVDENSNPFGLQYGRDFDGYWAYNLVWIGLSYIGGDKTSPSSWEWQNGEPVGFWNPSPQAFDPPYIDGIHMYINGSTRGDKGTWAFDDSVDIYPSMYLRGIIEVVPELTSIPVAVDIKPCSCLNPLNTKSRGVLPIAILGTDIFDANTIVPTSVRLAGVEPIRDSLEDVATPLTDPNECECSTVGPDGFIDLTLKFKTQQIVDALGEVNTGDILTLPLTGVLNDETPVWRQL